VRRDGNGWYFVIDLPRGEDDRRRQLKRQGFKSEKAARDAERAAKEQFRQLELNAEGTVAAELSRWLDERELDLSVTGVSSYRDYVRAYVVPHIGHLQMHTLDKQVVHDLYKKLLKGGGRGGKPLAATTVRTLHRILIKAFADLGLEITGIRQPRKPRKQQHGRKGVWTADQAAAFLKSVRDDRLYAAWTLAVVCGLRRGELAGLRWSNVDLERGVVQVEWQRTTATGQGEHGIVEKESKGSRARSIAIGDTMVGILREHRARQAAERVEMGVAYRDENRVFCWEDGTPYRPQYLTTQFAALCRRAGVPEIVLHDARHTSATVRADSGIPQHAMQDRLGHADARTTSEVYTHVLPEAQRRAADIMERVILGDG
jgi:integrase